MLNPYDPPLERNLKPLCQAKDRPSPTFLAIAISPLIYAATFWFTFIHGFRDIATRHPQARDTPLGFGIFAMTMVLISLPITYGLALLVFRPIIRTRHLTDGLRPIVMLAFAAPIAYVLGCVAVSTVPGLTPTQADRVAMTVPFVAASIAFSLTFFILSRRQVAMLPARAFQNVRTMIAERASRRNKRFD